MKRYFPFPSEKSLTFWEKCFVERPGNNGFWTCPGTTRFGKSLDSKCTIKNTSQRRVFNKIGGISNNIKNRSPESFQFRSDPWTGSSLLPLLSVRTRRTFVLTLQRLWWISSGTFPDSLRWMPVCCAAAANSHVCIQHRQRCSCLPCPCLLTRSLPLIVIYKFDGVIFRYPPPLEDRESGRWKEREAGRERKEKRVHREQNNALHLLCVSSLSCLTCSADTDIKTAVKSRRDVHMTVHRLFSGLFLLRTVTVKIDKTRWAARLTQSHAHTLLLHSAWPLPVIDIEGASVGLLAHSLDSCDLHNQQDQMCYLSLCNFALHCSSLRQHLRGDVFHLQHSV